MSNKVLSLPPLYKKTATGALQEWLVEVFNIRGFGEVVTSYGQVGGQYQITSDMIEEGKNVGKKNETTPLEQAQLQAQQQWEKKKKQGYQEDKEKAASTDNALDAIKPMLAHVYEDHPKKVSWPAYVQPKLDGMRCIAIVKDGVVKLYSRTQKAIETMPHIVAAVEKLAQGEDLILDGELYAHSLSDDFNKIMSIIKRNEIHPEHGLVEYHIYDMPSYSGSFRSRLNTLFSLADFLSPLKLVDTKIAESEEHMFSLMEEYLSQGYEGLMYRNAESAYEGKRSHGLLKVKTFRDEEFKATGVEEGNGKLQGKAGAIWCVTKDGKPFKAKMRGSLDSLTDYLVNFEQKYKGKMLTVKFQNYTPEKIPRFPVGIRFREEE